MSNECDTRLGAAVQAAEDAFWAELARQYPEADTGDLDPRAAMAFSGAASNAAEAWVRANATADGGPEPTNNTSRSEATLRCPCCHGTRIDFAESVPAYQAAPGFDQNGALLVDDDCQHADEGDDERLLCRECDHSWALDPQIDIEFVARPPAKETSA